MASSKGFVEILSLGERKNTRCKRNPIPFDNHTSIMNGVIREKNGLEHFGSRLAIHWNSRFDCLLKLDGLLDGYKRSDPHFSQSFDCLDDHFNIFTLFVRGGKQR